MLKIRDQADAQKRQKASKLLQDTSHDVLGEEQGFNDQGSDYRVVCDPTRDELFMAEQGFLRESRVAVN